MADGCPSTGVRLCQSSVARPHWQVAPVLPGLSTGLAAGCLSPRFYVHGVSSCGGARLCAAAEPIGAREAVNNQPRSIPATSRAGSPAPPRPPCSPRPPWELGCTSHHCGCIPRRLPASVLGAETRAPNKESGRGLEWGLSIFPHSCVPEEFGCWGCEFPGHEIQILSEKGEGGKVKPSPPLTLLPRLGRGTGFVEMLGKEASPSKSAGKGERVFMSRERDVPNHPA